MAPKTQWFFKICKIYQHFLKMLTFLCDQWGWLLFMYAGVLLSRGAVHCQQSFLSQHQTPLRDRETHVHRQNMRQHTGEDISNFACWNNLHLWMRTINTSVFVKMSWILAFGSIRHLHCLNREGGMVATVVKCPAAVAPTRAVMC